MICVVVLPSLNCYDREYRRSVLFMSGRFTGEEIKIVTLVLPSEISYLNCFVLFSFTAGEIHRRGVDRYTLVLPSVFLIFFLSAFIVSCRGDSQEME